MRRGRTLLVGLALALVAVSAAAEEAGDVPDIELPEQEILGELERPDVFFVLPRARERVDEQLLRSRLRRDLTRPLVREWVEESLLLD